MSRPRCKDYSITHDHSVILYGMRVPKGALYGTFKGYSQPLKYIVPTFPLSRQDTFTIYVYDRGRWQTAAYSHYRSLYRAVCGYIDKLNLFGHRTERYTGKIVFPSSAPYGSKQRAVGFKQANKSYLDRGGSGHPIYGDMRRTPSGEREYNFRSPNTIVFP